MFFSFLLLFIAPLAATVFYLNEVAEDQYISTTGFAIRSEELSSAADLLGSLSSVSGTSSSDSDILNEFIHSQDIVERVMMHINLEDVFSRPEYDPVFAYHSTGKIEPLVDYWERMVEIHYDQGTSLIELHVHAFRPDEAQAIAQRVVEESSLLINRLSSIARKDSTRYAQADLELAQDRLRVARFDLTTFRSETRIIDLSTTLQGEMGLLSSLEAQLATANIELNLLLDTSAREDDPRMVQASRRLNVIKDLIEKERAQFGIRDGNPNSSRNFSALVGELERLSVNLEYAQQSYLKSQTALDTSIAEASRKSRYLAVYTQPSLPQSPRYPDRFVMSFITAFFLFLGWCITILIYYSMRDRR